MCVCIYVCVSERERAQIDALSPGDLIIRFTQLF